MLHYNIYWNGRSWSVGGGGGGGVGVEIDMSISYNPSMTRYYRVLARIKKMGAQNWQL